MTKGSPTKCTPEITQQICQVLRAGNYICAACDYVGISERTYYNWITRGREELDRIEASSNAKPRDSERVFVSFLHATTRAKASAEVESVARIRKAAEEDWRADAWYLERSHSDRWGRTKVELEHSGTVETKVYHVRIDGDD